MKKTLLLLLATIPFFLVADHTDFVRPGHANGVIVTEPENVPPPPKPPAPKKAPPVVKRPIPLPPPAEEPVTVARPSPLEEALRLFEQRYFTKATALLEKIVIEEPHNAHAWYVLGRSYEAGGSFPRAQRAFRRALEIDPAFPSLSRVLQYPTDGDRRPLWDPRRPARIQEIPIAVDGFTILPPDSGGVRQSAPFSPAVPPVLEQQPPQYVPPSPRGQEPAYPVYIPPDPVPETPVAAPGLQPDGEEIPVYIPPSPGAELPR
jgi:hypothetical protein